MTMAQPPNPSPDEEPVQLSVEELLTELGNRNLWRPWGFNRDEFLPGLRGQQASKVFREMAENDPIVGSVLFAIEMVLRRVAWDVEPGGESPAAVEAADFVSSCMDDMSHSWEDFVSDILTMLPFGYAYLEIVYKQRTAPDQRDPTKRSRYTDGKLGWRKFMLIPQDTIARFAYDEHGGIQAAYQQAAGGSVEIPIEKAVLFRTTKRWPTGRSVLRNAYLPWYYKKRIEEVEGIGIERDLAGLPIIYLDPSILADATRKDEYQDIVVNIRRDEQEGVLLPAIYDEAGNKMVELALLSAAGTRQFDTDTVIMRHSRNMTMTLLQDVVMMGHERVGTQALASEKRDLSDTALTAWLGEIASVLNTHAIPRLMELNGFPMDEPPTLVPGDLRQEDVLGFTEAVRNIAQAGFALAGDAEIENFVRRRMGFPLMDEQKAADLEAAIAAGHQLAAQGAAAMAGGDTGQPQPPPDGSQPKDDGQAAPKGNGKGKVPPQFAKSTADYTHALTLNDE